MLERFLADEGARVWRLGESDCCTALAAWLMLNGRADLWAPLRERYNDADSWRRLVMGYGDVAAMVGEQARRIGLVEAARLDSGVVGVVGAALRPSRQWGAIYDGESWRVRTGRGFAAVSAPVLGAWGAR